MHYSLIILLILTLLLLLALNPAKSQKNIQKPIIVGSFEYQFVYNLTKHLHRTHQFTNFLIYRDLGIAKAPPCVIPLSLEETLMEEFGQSIFILGPGNNIKLRNHIGLNNLAFVDITSVNDPMMATVNTTLEGLHFMPMIFIFKRPDYAVPNMAEIEQFFTWCWSVNIVNVILTFRVIDYTLKKDCRPSVRYLQYQVFNYTPFPRITVRNLTSQIYKTSIFLPEKITNVYGYRFTTPIFMDPPTTFATPFEKHRHHIGEEDFAITGTAGRIYDEYIYRINGTIKLLPQINASFYSFHKRTLLLAAQKRIDIGIHPFSELLEFANQTEGSYPLTQTNACVIVPVVQEIDRSEYLNRTFEPITWFLGTVLTFGLLLFHLLLYFKHRSIYDNYGLSVLYSNGVSYQQSLPSSYFKNWSMPLKLFHVIVLLTIFVIQSSLTTSLTSLLSTTILGVQIETEAEFLASGLQIMLHEYEQQMYFDAERLPHSLRSRLYVTDLDNLLAHRDALNTSYAYVVTREQWRMLSQQQHNLWKPKFRIASDALCTANYFQKFPIQWDSPFASSLSLFSIIVQESGLSKKWEDLSIHQALQMNFIKVLVEDQEKLKPLTVSHFVMILTHLIWTYLIASVVLIFEIFHYKIKNKLRVREELRKN